MFTNTATAGDTKNVGSAAQLKGTVRLAVVFVSDDASQWSRKEQRIQKRRLKQGERWIQRQARSYNVYQPQFKHRTYGRWNNITIHHLPPGTRSGNENVEMVHIVSEKLGFESPQTWKNRFREDQFAVVIFLKRDGASYAIPQEIGLSPRYNVEGTVLYDNFEPDVPNCATCMAHELLHVFGAWDMYATFQITQDQMLLAQQRYPNSIMLRTSYNPYEITMDPVTCWRVGWCTKPHEAEVFRPRQMVE